MTDILIYGEVGWDVTAGSVRSQLERAGDADVLVHIDSPGGDAYEGLAIMNALRLHPGRVDVRVEGLAASSASIIAAGAGGRVEILQHAEMMIHEAWVFTGGTAKEMTKAAESLERVSSNIAEVYADRTGLSVDEVRDLMRAETWFTAEEAVAAGFADEAVRPLKDKTPEPVEARYSNKVMARYRYTSRERAPRPHITNHTPTDGQEVPMTDPIKALADALGKTTDEVNTAFNAIFNLEPNETTDKSATAAEFPEGDGGDESVTTSKTETPGETPTEDEANATPTETTTEGETPTEDEGEEKEETKEEDGDSAAATAAKEDEDYVLIPREHLDYLTKAAALASDAAQRQEATEREAEVDRWINEGRFSASLRASALSALESNPESARKVWGSLPMNTINRAESGYGVDTTDTTTTADTTRLNALADNVRFAEAPDLY